MPCALAGGTWLDCHEPVALALRPEHLACTHLNLIAQ